VSPVRSPADGRKRVAVVGAGAVGGFFAAELQAAGHEVVLAVRTPFDRLIVESEGVARDIPVSIVTDPQREGPVSWLLLAVKAHDTAAAAPWLARMADAATTVVILQNGVGHEERVAPLAPGATLLPALVYVAVERKSAGHIVHHKGNELVVPAGAAGSGLAELFRGSRIKVTEEPGFAAAIWRKLLGNVVANPITALTLQRIGIIADPDIRALARGLLSEAVAAARAEGADLTAEDVQRTIGELSGYSKAGGSSMLYDRLAGRPLEHEFITGAVVRAADRHGIDVPLNRAILALLRALDRSLQDGQAAG
jgi:2-dehydropantoate 2-reductase